MESLVVITGPAGSGKSTALHALEDMGYYGIDNLPLLLLEELATQNRTFLDKVAAVMDGRDPHFASKGLASINKVREQGKRVEILFLTANESTLVRRFSQLRRPHPLFADEPLSAAIAREQQLLHSLRSNASTVIDTSGLSPHQLKAQLKSLFCLPEEKGGLRLALFSFGFKHGMPPEADMVLDVRFLPNPYFVPELKEETGQKEEVASFVLDNAMAAGFFARLLPLFEYLIPLYEKEGKAAFTVAVGCTGGRHRSVAVVEMLRRTLQEKNKLISVWHREIDGDGSDD